MGSSLSSSAAAAAAESGSRKVFASSSSSSFIEVVRERSLSLVFGRLEVDRNLNRNSLNSKLKSFKKKTRFSREFLTTISRKSFKSLDRTFLRKPKSLPRIFRKRSVWRTATGRRFVS